MEVLKGGRGSERVRFRTPSQRRQERGDDFELEVVLVAVVVGTALESDLRSQTPLFPPTDIDEIPSLFITLGISFSSPSKTRRLVNSA